MDIDRSRVDEAASPQPPRHVVSNIKLSDIDQRRFGVRTARASAVTADNIDEVLGFCGENGVQFLIARCSSTDLAAARAMEDRGLRLAAVTMEYGGPISRSRFADGFRPATPADAPRVFDLALAAFARHRGHYHADPNLPRSQSTEAYSDWARKCCLGEAADVAVVGEADSDITAFGAARIDNGVAKDMLGFVSPGRRTETLLPPMAGSLVHHAACHGATRFHVETDAFNIAVQRWAVRVGLLPRRGGLTFHGWFGDRTPSP